MKTIIKRILSTFAKDSVFDSHLVINIIIKNYHDEYITFVTKHLAKTGQTAYAHSQLAKIIASFENTLVTYLYDSSLSYNIKGDVSKCALWQKLQ